MSYNFVAPGGHRNSSGGCVMEWVSLLVGNQVELVGEHVVVRWSEANVHKTDHPMCTHPYVTQAAIDANDHTSQEARNRLALLIPRLTRAGYGSAEFEVQLRINRRLELYLLERFIDRFRQRGNPPSALGEELLESMREYARDLVPWDEVKRLRARLAGWLEGIRPGTADDDNYGADAYLVNYASLEDDPAMLMAALSGKGVGKVKFVEDLLTQLEKIKADEGLLDDPTDLYLSEEELEAVASKLAERGEQLT